MEEIIRKANDSDVPFLRKLWEECFPKDVEYADFFFENIFRKPCAVVCEADGERVGMIHVFPRILSTPDGELSAKYIYGVGTTTSARGRGIAGRLLKGEECDCDVLLLIPQSESLFSFYEKYGFSHLAKISKEIVSPNGEILLREADYDDVGYMNSVYERSLEGAVFARRDADTWKLLINEYRFLGGGFKVFDGGYCAYYEEDGKLFLTELFGSVSPCAVAGGFGRACSVITRGESEPIAVIKPVSEKGKAAIAKFSERYINLMHN